MGTQKASDCLRILEQWDAGKWEVKNISPIFDQQILGLRRLV
jgi:hypothetical protein